MNTEREQRCRLNQKVKSRSLKFKTLGVLLLELCINILKDVIDTTTIRPNNLDLSNFLLIIAQYALTNINAFNQMHRVQISQKYGERRLMIPQILLFVY